MQVKLVVDSLFVLCKTEKNGDLDANNRAAAHHITSKFCTNNKDTFNYVV